MIKLWIALLTASVLCAGLTQTIIAEAPDFTFTATFEGNSTAKSNTPSNSVPDSPNIVDNSYESPVTSPESADISSYAGEVLRLINLERTAAGLSELSADPTLSTFAQTRATELSQNFSHTRPDGTKCFTVFDSAQTDLTPTGENIAFGQETPESVVRAWMNSQGHKDNILSKDASFLGVGVYRTDNEIFYWTQIFAK